MAVANTDEQDEEKKIGQLCNKKKTFPSLEFYFKNWYNNNY